MNAVGDGVDLETGEERLRDFAVLFGDAVDEVAEVQRQHRHIQFFRPGQFAQQRKGDDFAHDPFDHLVGEMIVSGLHRGMGGEDALFAEPFAYPMSRVRPRCLRPGAGGG